MLLLLFLSSSSSDDSAIRFDFGELELDEALGDTDLLGLCNVVAILAVLVPAIQSIGRSVSSSDPEEMSMSSEPWVDAGVFTALMLFEFGMGG